MSPALKKQKVTKISSSRATRLGFTRESMSRPRFTVVIEHACPSTSGSYTLKIDLVDQHICWFEECGSQPLILPVEIS
jgi:hypothetical protein